MECGGESRILLSCSWVIGLLLVARCSTQYLVLIQYFCTIVLHRIFYKYNCTGRTHRQPSHRRRPLKMKPTLKGKSAIFARFSSGAFQTVTIE
jgi:hypothetical protein